MRACEKYSFVSLRTICSRYTYKSEESNKKVHFAIYHRYFVFYRPGYPITLFFNFVPEYLGNKLLIK